ncbi:hypothetical protein LR48_Vigan08g041300 [Vigna angularis]|uniref:Uncharacterized protein n=1 Tax=Phaseolus angularis TaxID=3914 RepID=A0A0L9V3P4_PHAAN|nr:hypothetical protein LR48_Vigan08g041300 [Vigna angularis]
MKKVARRARVPTLDRGSNHAKLTTKDICLIHALKENIQTNWLAAISDNMIKVTRMDVASLPYANSSLKFFNITMLISPKKLVNLLDENQEEEEANPLNIGTSSNAISFRRKTEVEKFMVRQMHSLSTLTKSRFDKIDKEIAAIQQKLGIHSLDDDNDDDENENEEKGEVVEEDGEDEDDKEEESEEERTK